MGNSHTYLYNNLMSSAMNIMESASDPARPLEGWSAKVIIGHISDVDEQVWLRRIRLIVDAFRKNLPIPSLAWWEPDPVATELKFRDLSLDQVSARLFDSRTAIIRTLSDLAPEEWEALALHETFGTLSVTSLTEKLLLHDDEHLTSLS